MGAQALSPITTPSPRNDRTDSDIPKGPIRTSERSPLPPEPTRKAATMSNARYARARPRGRGVGAVHACTDDYERQALDLVARGDALDRDDPEVIRLDRRLRRLGQRWSKSLRRAGDCDCGLPMFTWDVGPGSIAVHPAHLPDCRATIGRPTRAVTEDNTIVLPMLSDD